MPVCILLADHWGINPNELLMLADAEGIRHSDGERGTFAHRGSAGGEGDRANHEPGDEEDGGGGDISISK